MIKKVLAVGAIIIMVGMLWLMLSGKNNNTSLVSPKLLKTFTKPLPAPSETPVLPNSPKTFQFDSSTDLKVELEKVNPQVLDSDFNE